jgi:uncharacterized protein YyaL (SSP411 family)
MYHYLGLSGEARVPDLLADAIAMGKALLDANAVTGDESYLERSILLAHYVLEHHLDPRGGFYDIRRRGEGNLQVPLRLLTQNAATAQFFSRLASLSGEEAYRNWAYRALQAFPNAHRDHGAFAAGFGQATVWLLRPALRATLRGRPGDPRLRTLLRTAATGLQHPNIVLRFEQSPGRSSIEIEYRGRLSGPITDSARLGHGLIEALDKA